jgi:hypothetical protein
MRVVWALAVVGLVAGCGGDGKMDPGVGGGGATDDMGSQGLPDGFIQSGCQMASDCDDNNPCTTDTCPLTHECAHTPVDCSAMTDQCNAGQCDAHSGSCVAMPANESKACTDASSGAPGTCTQGFCSPVPQCNLDFTSLDCSSFSASTTGTTSGTSVLDTYACATGESGPETSYPFQVATDRMVTFTLTGLTADLDLIVLEGANCVASAACAGHSTTVGTGDETVSFMAKGGMPYVVVVEGKAGAMGDFTLNIGCVGGTCKPIKALGCNQTIMGNTSGTNSTSVISNFDCDMNTIGPEDTYSLTQSADTNYKMTLSGLTSDLDLVVVLDSGGECDPTFCKASNVMSGTANETVSFTGFSSSTYDVVIDSKTTGGGPYQLEVDCPPSCYTDGNTIDCTSPSDTRMNNDTAKSKKVVDNWACAPNELGSEVVYRFSPSTSGMYTFTLSGLTADLDLIVVEGDYSTCDPTAACVKSSVTAGTGNETVTFMADSSKYYFIAVDAKDVNAVSNYTLKMTSTSCPGPSCYNSANKLDCTYLEDTRKNNDSNHSKAVVDAWACDMNTTGNEVVYAFTPQTAGSYTVTLDGLTADLDLVVVSNASAFTCDPTSACEAMSEKTGTTAESLTFNALTTKTYYIAVDGKNGAVSSYHIKLASTACGAAICQNGYDTLSCSSPSTTNRNDASGATSDVTNWACDTGMNGPEFAHHFSPTTSGSYTFEMIGLKADLDLIVIEAGTGSTCSPTAACVASSKVVGTGNEKVTFTADSTKDYYVVVDGRNGATSQYTLAITDGCP